MAKITIEIDEQTMSRLTAVACARHATVEDVLLQQAGQVGSLAPVILHNPAHSKMMAALVRSPADYETRREELYDRERQRAEVYAAHRSRLLQLIDDTDGDSGGQPWSRGRLYVR